MYPNIDVVQIFVIVIIAGLLILAFTYLVDFLKPIIMTIVLLVIAYILYSYFIAHTISF